MDPAFIQRVVDNDPNLKRLVIGEHANISAIVAALRGNTSIQELIFDGTEMPDEACREFCQWLANNITVVTFVFNGCVFNEALINGLALALARNMPIGCLAIRSTDITAQQMLPLMHALRENEHLNTLAFECVDFGADGPGALINEILNCPNLKRLTLKEVGMFIDDGRRLAAMLRAKDCALEFLDVGCNDLDSEGVAFIAGALAGNPSLASLDLGATVTGDPAIRALADALRTNTRLKSLCLYANYFTAEGLRHLCDALRENTTLEKLDLGHCSLNDACVALLAEALKVNTGLKALHLSDNVEGGDEDNPDPGVGIEGARALAEMLQQNTTLTKLVLSNNCIDDAAVRVLVDAIKLGVPLENLDLSVNSFGADGFRALADLLQSSTFLKKLSTRFVETTEADVNVLVEAIGNRSAPITLDVTSAHTGVMAARLQQAVRNLEYRVEHAQRRSTVKAAR